MDSYNNMQNSNYGVRIATFAKVWKVFIHLKLYIRKTYIQENIRHVVRIYLWVLFLLVVAVGKQSKLLLRPTK